MEGTRSIVSQTEKQTSSRRAAADSPGGKRTHYRWVVCGLLFFATTINYVDRQVFGILGPRLTEEFHWTESDFSFIVSAFTLAYAVGYTVAGRMMDWIGERKGFAAGRRRVERRRPWRTAWSARWSIPGCRG